MSINPQCKNRIKPPMLREQKTEALLVFVRTTLEEYFKELENETITLIIGSKEDAKLINDVLKDLLLRLQECVVNSSYLRSLTIGAQKKKLFTTILKKEEPLIIYYDSIVKSIEKNLQSGSTWIPELMVIALLSEWVLEEEKSVSFYPFLKEIDYLELLSKYENIKNDPHFEKTIIIMDMFKLSTKLIASLNKANYSSKKTKKRNKKR
jgi:hypothetical protein